MARFFDQARQVDTRYEQEWFDAGRPEGKRIFATVTAGQLFSDPLLFELYPKLAELPVFIKFGPSDSLASYRNENGAEQLTIYPDEHRAQSRQSDNSGQNGATNQAGRPNTSVSGEQQADRVGEIIGELLKRSVVHELQHAIQDREGFAAGSNTSYVLAQRDDDRPTVSLPAE